LFPLICCLLLWLLFYSRCQCVAAHFANATALQIVLWLGFIHPCYILREKSFPIIRRQFLNVLKRKVLWGRPRFCGERIDVRKLRMIEETYETFICRWYLFSRTLCQGCQPQPVPDCDIMSCHTSEIEVVSQGRTHACVPKMSQHQVERL